MNYKVLSVSTGLFILVVLSLFLLFWGTRYQPVGVMPRTGTPVVVNRWTGDVYILGSKPIEAGNILFTH